ncbi:MAG: hypothetical protein HYW06_07955 [Gemmatimonadetes bacterium]|nr:hypothetical protein [Gemmatimonadota bacterium]
MRDELLIDLKGHEEILTPNVVRRNMAALPFPRKAGQNCASPAPTVRPMTASPMTKPTMFMIATISVAMSLMTLISCLANSRRVVAATSGTSRSMRSARPAGSTPSAARTST